METKYTFDRVIRLCITAGIVVALYLLIRRLSGVLLPFLISWLIAYLLYPIVLFFQNRCRFRYRMLSTITTLLIVVGVVAGLTTLVVPLVSEEAGKLSIVIGQYLQDMKSLDLLPKALQDNYRAWLSSIDLTNMWNNPDVIALVQNAMPHVWAVISSSANILIGLSVVFICVLYIVFILQDYEQLSNWSALIPAKYRSLTEGIASDIELNMNRYFRGQSLVALCVGVLFAIGFEVIGLPLAILTGLFIGVLNLVPYLQVVGIVPCVLLGILQSAETGRPIWLEMVLIAVVFVVVQMIQDFVLTPRIMGKTMGLHPAVILLSLSIWGSLLGIVGMIIALPLTTLILSYYHRFILKE
ncbi:MAG: AI-2E family transporter [Paludibacteraceae bacterium]|nr:AI-2E family transporter [Paludibacteraceae bacterium]